VIDNKKYEGRCERRLAVAKHTSPSPKLSATKSHIALKYFIVINNKNMREDVSSALP
jgi:hypothetical protein